MCLQVLCCACAEWTQAIQCAKCTSVSVHSDPCGSCGSPPRCVYVDAGVSAIDVETRRRKAARQRQAEEAKVVQEKGEMALLAMEPPKPEREERVQLRPPMLQVSGRH